MKLSNLQLINLPKSFNLFKVYDYLVPNAEEITDPEDIEYDEYPAECDEDRGEDARVFFQYQKSATGVFLNHSTLTQSLEFWLSPWAVEADVRLYALLVRTIMQKHPRSKLFDKYAPLKELTEADVERMIEDRKKYLKRQLKKAEGFIMGGINHDYPIRISPDCIAPTLDIAVRELQHQFAEIQWGNNV